MATKQSLSSFVCRTTREELQGATGIEITPDCGLGRDSLQALAIWTKF